ncbi:MAG TPA: YfhO family protein, partial [Vicinamibacteria bacterium]|nr:YfhO family protein [Vicinamibacteria bacterium]
AALHRPDPERIDVHAEGPGVLVLAEAWSPGWRAAVDGQPARLLRVNYALMGVALPPGSHRVTFRHRVSGLPAGFALSALGAAVGGVALLRGRRRERRRFARG